MRTNLVHAPRQYISTNFATTANFPTELETSGIKGLLQERLLSELFLILEVSNSVGKLAVVAKFVLMYCLGA